MLETLREAKIFGYKVRAFASMEWVIRREAGAQRRRRLANRSNSDEWALKTLHTLTTNQFERGVDSFGPRGYLDGHASSEKVPSPLPRRFSRRPGPCAPRVGI